MPGSRGSAVTAGCVVPYERLVAMLGVRLPATATPRLEPGVVDASQRRAVASRCRRRAGAHHSRRIARADHLPRRRAALDRGTRRGGDQLAARDRTVGRQVLYGSPYCRRRACPTPETVVCERLRTDGDGGRRASWATSIIKPIFGSMGHGIVRVSDPDVAFRVVRALEQIRAVFLRAAGGRSRRTRCAGVRRRRPRARCDRARGARGDWRSNVSRGSGPRSLRTAARVGVAGGARGGGHRRRLRRGRSAAGAGRSIFVLEVNGIPGWQGLQQATGWTWPARSSITSPSAAAHWIDRTCDRKGVTAATARRRVARPSGSTAGAVSGAAANRVVTIPWRDAGERRRRIAAQLACCSRRRAPKPGNVSPGRISATSGTRTSWSARSRLADPLAMPRVADRRDGPAGDRRDGALDTLQHQSRYRAPARAAGSRGVPVRDRTRFGAASGDPACRSQDDPGADHRRRCPRRVRRDSRSAPGGLGRAERTGCRSRAARCRFSRRCGWPPIVTTSPASTPPVTRRRSDRRSGARAGARNDGLSWDDAVVETFLTLLAAVRTPISLDAPAGRVRRRSRSAPAGRGSGRRAHGGGPRHRRPRSRASRTAAISSIPERRRIDGGCAFS